MEDTGTTTEETVITAADVVEPQAETTEVSTETNEQTDNNDALNTLLEETKETKKELRKMQLRQEALDSVDSIAKEFPAASKEVLESLAKSGAHVNRLRESAKAMTVAVNQALNTTGQKLAEKAEAVAQENWGTPGVTGQPTTGTVDIGELTRKSPQEQVAGFKNIQRADNTRL